MVSVANAMNNTVSFAYSGSDLVSVTDSLGRSTRFVYDAIGRVLMSIDPIGNTTEYKYDSVGRVTETTDPMSHRVRFGYDLNGNMISSTDQRGNITLYTYDIMDRLSTRTDPLGNAETFTYASNSRPERVVDREGKISQRSYDSKNRLASVAFGATASAPTLYESTIQYTYDKGDRLVRVLDSAGGAIESTYDGLDRLTSQTTPQGTVSYVYDNAGRRTQMLASGAQSIDYDYDAASRLTEVRNAVSATAAQDVVRITYNNADRYSKVQLRNGVNLDYSYDAAGQLRSMAYSTAVATIGDMVYEYDAAGKVTRTSGSLAKIDLPAAMSGRAYNANNQLTLPGYTYDRNGRLTSNGVQSYLWNARGELKQIQSGPTLVGEFSYDAAGRRTRKSILSTPTQFLYDGPNIIQELGDGVAPTVDATILTGLRTDEAFGRTTGTTTTEYLTDRLGSTIALSDASASSVTTYSYEPYGNTTQAGAPNDNTRGFTGREIDGTGLLYYRARYYDPIAGRFISEDPLVFGSSDSNLYRYTAADPVNRFDPTGTTAIPWPAVIPICVAMPELCILAPLAAAAGAAVGLCSSDQVQHFPHDEDCDGHLKDCTDSATAPPDIFYCDQCYRICKYGSEKKWPWDKVDAKGEHICRYRQWRKN